MKLFHSLVFALCISLSSIFIFQINAFAENTAQGNLTVDGEVTKINHAYADIYDGDNTIVLVDNPIKRENIPDNVYSLGEQGKIKGIVFVVSEKEKKLMSGGLYNLINAIHSHPKWNKLGTVGNGVLEITSSNGETLSGKIKTPAENEVDGHKFTYDISFNVSLKKEKLELTMSGKSDEPSKAFGAWGKALFAGDTEQYKKYCSKEVLEMLPDDAEELKSGMEFQQSMFPNMIYIESSEISGNKAELKAMGKRGEEISTGKITMLKEDGAWKVNKQSWESE